MRNSWDNPDALWVGIKAGYNQVNHGHLDLGNFEFDLDGVRWAVDLGRDDYNLPGYWERNPSGRRWNYYRLRSLSHNVVLLDGADQDVKATSHVIARRLNVAEPYTVVDLSSAYPNSAESVLRGVMLVNQRTSLLVQDEIALKGKHDVAWGITTAALTNVNADGSAVLRQDGREVVARILEPAGAQFSVESAQQDPPEKTNEGYSRLVIRLPEQEGMVRIAVLFSRAGDTAGVPVLKPLADWP
jgi:hypothetical protein